MFPQEDRYWLAVRSFLERRLVADEPVLAPNEFIEFFPCVYAYRASYALDPRPFQVVVLHKDMLDELVPAHLAHFLDELVPVFANDVFVVLARGAPRRDRIHGAHVRALHERADAVLSRPAAPPTRSVAVVNTHERAEALSRSLPQIADLGVETLVVDDGSSPACAARVARLCEAAGARRIRFEENRGLPAAMNAGIAYWLADPGVAWISVFQDDVDVRPDLLRRLEKVQDPLERPILTGRVDPKHRAYGGRRIRGVGTLQLRSAPGIHLHAHRDYWAGVMPIPTPYLGAPKTGRGLPGQGSDEDFWITCWSPRSVVKRGGFVTCLPGLVRTFAPEVTASTWSPATEEEVDPPLASIPSLRAEPA